MATTKSSKSSKATSKSSESKTNPTKSKSLKTSSEKGSRVSKRKPSTATTAKKPHRYRPGTVALREVRKFQKSTRTLLPSQPFERLVREIAKEIHQDNFHWQENAIIGCQEMLEKYLTCLFSKANDVAMSGKRLTVNPKDFDLVKSIRSEPDYY